ncbi:MAG: 30S ribosomal protein S5 [Micavibrio sp.]|nr:30S ribosomal protein S5 [Micavibrio sp.]
MAQAERAPKEGRDGRDGERKGKPKGKRDRDNNAEGERDGEIIERLVAINRVAKTVKGGRRMAFAALIVVGDGRGRIGVGAGKAREVPEAIRKATEQAKSKMIRVPLREGRTLHHDIEARFGAGRVRLRTAVPGTGIIAGGPLRAVFEVIGIQDVVAKSLGSSNPYNMVKAAIEAFKLMESPRMVAGRRGRRVNEVLGRKGDEKEKSDD